MPYIAYQRHTPSGLSGLDAASENVKGQLGLMAGMQQLAGFKQDYDRAQIEQESGAALAEGVQELVRQRFAGADGLVGKPSDRAQRAIDLAGRMKDPRHAAIFLEGVQGVIAQEEQEKRARDFANRLSSIPEEFLPPEVRDSIMEIAQTDLEAANREYIRWARSEGSRAAQAANRTAAADFSRRQAAEWPKPARESAEELIGAYERGAWTDAQFEDRWSRLERATRSRERNFARDLKDYSEALDALDGMLDIDDETREKMRDELEAQFMGGGGAVLPAGGADVLPPGGGVADGSPFDGLTPARKRSAMRKAARVIADGGSTEEVVSALSDAGLDVTKLPTPEELAEIQALANEMRQPKGGKAESVPLGVTGNAGPNMRGGPGDLVSDPSSLRQSESDRASGMVDGMYGAASRRQSKRTQETAKRLRGSL